MRIVFRYEVSFHFNNLLKNHSDIFLSQYLSQVRFHSKNYLFQLLLLSHHLGPQLKIGFMIFVVPRTSNQYYKLYYATQQFYLALLMSDTPVNIADSYPETPQESQILKKPHLQQTKPDHNFSNSNNKSLFNSLIEASITEQQLTSHPLIKEIILKSKQKTLLHKNISVIPIDTQLYKVPRNFDNKQFKYDIIPHNNPDFSCSSSHKVKQINEKLTGTKTLSQRLEELANKNKNEYRKKSSKRPVSTGDKRVSISGLVSYSFNSVKARKSLGNIPDIPQDQALQKESNKMKVSRRASIINRKPNPISVQRQSVSNAAISDFQTPTDIFLSCLLKQKQKDLTVYGQKMEKLCYIKDYMQKQKVSYDNAKHIVEEIDAPNKVVKKVKRREPFVIDDDAELSNRKSILKKKRVMAKHLYFVE